MTDTPPNVFTVPPGRPFLAALADAILAGNLPHPGGPKPAFLDLPSWTILLPNRRAARALQEAFLVAAGGGALLLPSIRPIAEGQEDLGLIESAIAAPGFSPAEADVPPAIGPLERILLLTQLVTAWSSALRRDAPDADPDTAAMRPFAAAGASTPAQAARLAGELARLIDAVETENVSLASLADLVPEAYSAHWQQTLEFLRIVTEYWPAELAERGVIAPSDRRNRIILAEAQRLAASPPQGPIIVAGVTGSVPATAELMRTVAGLPGGAVVLPGLDPHLEAQAFASLTEQHPEHPQFGLAKLVSVLGLARDAVKELPGKPLDAARIGRNRLISEAMRPSGSMAGWRRLAETADRAALRLALADVSLVEAPTAEDEAEVVALILREAAETPGRTAALVSPDRLLARRVAVRLAAWGIRVDDSAGRPFAKTVPGAYLDLVGNAQRSAYAPADLMALLKHPLTRLGLTAGDVRRAGRNLEIVALRATYLGRGLDGVENAVERARLEAAEGVRRGRAVSRMREQDWQQVRDLITRLRVAVEPLTELESAAAAKPFGDIVRTHVTVAEAIARPAEAVDEDDSPLWDRDEGEAAATLLARLMDPASPQPLIQPADYPEFFRTLVGSESVRTRVPVHPRLFIWGPYEARLQQPDVVVLGSLNEGVWPKAADPGPWLNRGMQAALGLPLPEEETGRAAHDVTILLGAETVIMTRASKVSGVPMVASRWLLRLEALLDGLGLGDALIPDQPWARWGRARDYAIRTPALDAPAPCPPLRMRPRKATVSDVETWLANPYAIYARQILRLEALPLLGQPPGPSERGQIVHETLARFTKAYPSALPSDTTGAFMALADEVIGALGAEARVKAFWRPRLERFAQWFAATEPARRGPGSSRLVEVSGSLVLAAPAGPFELRARADRIDMAPEGLVISDYKTGRIPSTREVESGLAPQLPLEAAIAQAGMFPGVTARPVTALRYIRATGGEPAGEEMLVTPKGATVAEIAATALENLAGLIAEFDDEATPYRALRRRSFDYTYDDYAHLARLGEWATDEGGEGPA